MTDTTTETPAVQQAVLAQPALMAPAAVRQCLSDIRAELNMQFLERGEVIEGIILAVLAKEHGVILGPPGTAKTALTRTFFGRFTGAEYFEAILSKTRPAEAVLGPFDIPELRDHGHLFRKINGFLPTANFAMLDEFGKMSPTLGHDLLAVILERRLHQVNGGRSWLDLPLYTFIGGSNELPTEESDDAAALWDRVLVRMVVDQVQEAGNFVAMLNPSPLPTAPTTVDFPSLANVVDNEVPAVKIPKDVLDTLVQLRGTLRAEQIDPSGRRWRQCMKLLQAAAWLGGRTEASTDDIAVLRHSLWEDPTQKQKVERLTLQVSNPFAEAALALQEKADEILGEVNDAKGLSDAEKATLGVQLAGRIKSLLRESNEQRQRALAQGASTTKIDEITTYVATIHKKVLSDVLNLDPSLMG